MFQIRLNSSISRFVRLRPPHGLPGGRSIFGGVNGLTLTLAKRQVCPARYWPSGLMSAHPLTLRNSGCPTEGSQTTRVNGRAEDYRHGQVVTRHTPVTPTTPTRFPDPR